MSQFIVYGLIDPITNMVRYIGQSSRGMKRPNSHRKTPKTQTYCSRWIQTLNELNLRFEICILEECKSKIELNVAERWWILYGKASGWNLTNLTNGGEGTFGFKRSSETKEKDRIRMIEFMKRPDVKETSRQEKTNRFVTDETRAKLSAIAKNRSEEWKEKLRKPRSEEAKQNISLGTKIAMADKEVSAKIVASNKRRIGMKRKKKSS